MDSLGAAADLPPVAAEVPGVRVVHAALPGRVRLHLASLRRAPALAAAAEQGLAAIPGVQRVSANVRTGSILVLFDPALAVARLIERLTLLASLPGAVPGAEADWHARDVTEVASALGSSAAGGLGSTVARARLAEVGQNALPRPEPRAPLAILADQFKSLPVLLLAGAGALSLLTGAVVEAAAIVGVLLLNGGLGFTVESRSERRIAGLSRPPAAAARVMRDGAAHEVPFAEVVPGDLLLLRPGTLVAADARLVQARDLSVNEAMLTGESLPVAKSTAALGAGPVPLGARTNMVFRGTAVTGGTGTALAVATGAHTEMGRIQRLLGAATRPATPMERQLGELSRKLIGVALLASVSVLGIGFLRGFGLRPTLATAVALAVAAIPEGLPTVATSALARGIGAMRGQGALVRRLDALETLGAVQVVCFDKTGTLTENRMSVSVLATPDAQRLLEISVLCSEAELDADGVPLGSATEAALLAHAQAAGIDVAALRAAHPRLGVRYRSEVGRFMATFHRLADGGTLVAVKGSPDEVLDLCALDAAARAAIERENAALARDGLRVLGFACVRRPAAAGAAVADLTFLGLAALADPLRPEAPAQLAALRAAGVHCLVLTGDQDATARAVAAAVGLGGTEGPRVIDGLALDGLDDAALAEAARRSHVFARVTPSQKLRVVQALQRADVVVAMVGDGLNDGPALKAADVGIAMGREGAEAAREVANIVLLNDGLSGVVAGMRQGRAARDNVQRAARYLLATNLSEILLVLAATAAGIAVPLAPLQLLWINLISDVLPGLALTAEPPEPGLMQRPPPPHDAAVLDTAALGGLAVDGGVIAAGALASSLLARGPAEARSVAFGSLTVAQLLQAFACRPHGPHRGPNPAVAATVTLSLAGQGAAMLVPGLRRLLGVTPIGATAAAAILAGSVGPWVVNEMRARNGAS